MFGHIWFLKWAQSKVQRVWRVLVGTSEIRTVAVHEFPVRTAAAKEGRATELEELVALEQHANCKKMSGLSQRYNIIARILEYTHEGERRGANDSIELSKHSEWVTERRPRTERVVLRDLLHAIVLGHIKSDELVGCKRDVCHHFLARAHGGTRRFAHCRQVCDSISQ